MNLAMFWNVDGHRALCFVGEIRKNTSGRELSEGIAR